MKNRDDYLKKLLNFKDTDLIKVITGVRRCGKSSLLKLLKQYLLDNDISEEFIIEMNFESLEYANIKNYIDLYNEIKNKIKNSKKKYYILLDEIQEVEDWEKALRSFRVDFNCDIYVTGSNAHLLSGELATFLSGRCIQIKMLPLSFKEFLDFYDFEESWTLDDKFIEYLKYGGLPSLSNLKQDPEVKSNYLSDICDMVLKRDVIARNSITDVGLLEKILIYISQNIGCSVSSKKISDYLTSSGNPTTHNTVDNYLTFLENAYVIYKVPRYDIKGKTLLKTLGKYYIVDTGIRNAIIGYREDDIGHILENIIYLELIRRGYEVTIGKNDDLEIDFIATDRNEKKYYQVTKTILESSVLEREKKSFIINDDHFEKTILSLDKTYLKTTENGIHFKNIIEFLMEDEM